METSDVANIALAAAAIVVALVALFWGCLMPYLVSKPRMEIDVNMTAQSLIVTLRNSGGSPARIVDIIRDHPSDGQSRLAQRRQFHKILGDGNIERLTKMNDSHVGSLSALNFGDGFWVGACGSVDLLTIDLATHDDCRFDGKMVYYSNTVQESRFLVVYQTVYTGWMGWNSVSICRLI